MKSIDTSLTTKHSKNRSFLRRALLLIPLALTCFALFDPSAFGVVPAPDGGYLGGNTAEGQHALLSLTSGTYNTGVGLFSLRSNAEGNFNTAVGAGTLLANTGSRNTATGAGALLSNTTAEGNTANGTFALFSNTTGENNTANGAFALFSSTEASGNTADGNHALFSNTTGTQNTATGAGSLLNNTTGGSNTANGAAALFSNTEGVANTAIGDSALLSNTTGGGNTALGAGALFSNTTEGFNTAIGSGALIDNTTGAANTAVGFGALSFNLTGNSNIALGVQAGTGVTTANNVICIGAQVSGVDISNSCFIGNIRGVPTGIGDAISVIIDSNGQLGTISSSRQFKKDIKPMDEASEGILALKPVTFHYKIDKTATPQFGLIAEEVAEVNPDLVAHDKNGEIYTVRYEAVNAMLLNEFLKEHSKVQELEKSMAALTAQLKEQAVQIQKVSAQVEVTKPATTVASLPAIASRPTVALRAGGDNP
jgi:hypothetical protein